MPTLQYTIIWVNLNAHKVMTGLVQISKLVAVVYINLEVTMDSSIKDLPTPPMSTVSAQATKRATCGEHEVGLSWFSLRQRSKSTNSFEQPCLIFWITGLFSQMNFPHYTL